MKYSPEFEAVMKRLRALPRSEYNSLENRKLFVLAYHLAPPELKAMFDKGLEEKGLLPKAGFCDDQGRPVYSTEDLAQHFGDTNVEIRNNIKEINELIPGSIFDTGHGAVYRIQ